MKITYKVYIYDRTLQTFCESRTGTKVTTIHRDHTYKDAILCFAYGLIENMKEMGIDPNFRRCFDIDIHLNISED